MSAHCCRPHSGAWIDRFGNPALAALRTGLVLPLALARTQRYAGAPFGGLWQTCAEHATTADHGTRIDIGNTGDYAGELFDSQPRAAVPHFWLLPFLSFRRSRL